MKLGIFTDSHYSSSELTCGCRYNSRSLEKINNSIYIVGGEAKPDINDTITEYTECNPAIESSIVAATKHLPHLEKPAEVYNLINMFFN